MKIIRLVSPPCDCLRKLRSYIGGNVCVGSIIECDCGIQYELDEDQRDGKYWKRLPL